MKKTHLRNMYIFPIYIGDTTLHLNFDALEEFVGSGQATRRERYMYNNVRYIFNQ